MDSGPARAHVRAPRISREDIDALERDMLAAFEGVAEKYYLDAVRPKARQRGSKLVVEFDVVEKNS